MSEFLDTVPWANAACGILILSVAALLANFVVKALLVKGLMKVLSFLPFGSDEEIMRQPIIPRLANIVPALVVSHGILMVPDLPATVAAVIVNVSKATVILSVVLALSAAINVVDTVYHRRPERRTRSIKGYLQVVKLAMFALSTILILATLMDRSPVILLSGLGAMAAVLMLVFQDTLLSFVASVQISQSDMLRVGDWIEMPALNADGEVIEVALHTVKVQNWDKTITTLPTRRLISDPFKNWRGMQESGGRRIKRSLLIDQAAVRFLSEDEISRLSKIGVLERYLKEKREEVSRWNEALGERAFVAANTRRLTNIGTFRAYVLEYLRNHPGIHKGMTLMVRQLQPGPEGLPLEIYCFTNTVAWVDYEAIQSDVFDHLYAVMPEFGLRPFQAPSGADLSARFAAAA